MWVFVERTVGVDITIATELDPEANGHVDLAQQVGQIGIVDIHGM